MKNKLAYFISKSSMLAIGYFLLFKYVGYSSWISVILGTLIGIIIIYIYTKIKKVLNKKYLQDILKKHKLGKIFLIILILFYSLLIIINLLVLSMFVNSFYLLNTPKYIIIIPFLLLAIYLIYKDKYVLLSLSNLLFYGSLLIVVIFSFLLIPYLDISELLPLSFNSLDIIKCSLIYASITCIPEIIVLNYYNNNKNIYKDYLIGSLLNLIITLGTILGLGNLIKIYSFPEYDVLKQIKILDFIENIENISALGWYSELFMVLTTIIDNLKESLPNRYNKQLLLIIILIISYITAFVIGGNYIITIKLIYIYPYILLVFFLFFIILLFFLKYKKNNT